MLRSHPCSETLHPGWAKRWQAAIRQAPKTQEGRSISTAVCKDTEAAMGSSLFPIQQCASSTGVRWAILVFFSFCAGDWTRSHVKGKCSSSAHTVARDLLIFCWIFFVPVLRRHFALFSFEIFADTMTILALQKGLQRRPASVFRKRLDDSYSPFLTGQRRMCRRACPGPVVFVLLIVNYII